MTIDANLITGFQLGMAVTAIVLGLGILLYIAVVKAIAYRAQRDVQKKGKK